MAIVNKGIIPLRSRPSNMSECIDEVLLGMNIEILKSFKNNWFYIRTDYNYEGYIHGEGLIIDNNKYLKWNREKNKVVINSFADVLNKPEASGIVLKKLTRGACLIYLNEISINKKFAKVKMPSGEEGWLRCSFLDDLKTSYDIEDEKALRNSIAESALSYLGTQYRWGGKTPEGIDCSGLCSMAYMLNGILIYRDAKIKDGFPIKEIPYNKLKRGDLIFFPGHVALYLGNNEYIHSSTSNDVVKINSFNKYSKDYLETLANSPKEFGSIFE